MSRLNRAVWIFMSWMSLVVMPERIAAGVPVMEADNCMNCDFTVPSVPGQALEISRRADEIMEKVQEVSAACKEKTAFIDPKRRSFLQRLDLDYDGTNPSIVVGRSALTCLFGALNGGVDSMRDLVLALPRLFGLSWDAMKSGARKIGAKIGDFDFQKWLDDFQPQKVWTSAKDSLDITRESVKETFQKSSQGLYEAYQEGGITGSLAAVAQVAFHQSPFRAVGKYLTDIAVQVAEATAKEWSTFQCLDVEVRAEVVCKVLGYIATDIATGTLALSFLGKSGKFVEALKKTRASLERKPIVGNWLMRNLKAMDSAKCDRIPEASWMRDSRVTLQEQDIDIHRAGGILLARGIDPKSGKMGCFQVVGKAAAEMSKRIDDTEVRSLAHAPATPAGPSEVVDDFYSYQSRAYARTDVEFVSDINKKNGISISAKDASRIATVLATDPTRAKQYGKLMKTVEEIRTSNSRVAGIAQETVRALNPALLHAGASKRINLDLIDEALQEALVVGKPDSLLVVQSALRELSRASKGSGSIEAALESWRVYLTRTRKHLSDRDVRQAQECLFPGSKSAD